MSPSTPSTKHQALAQDEESAVTSPDPPNMYQEERKEHDGRPLLSSEIEQEAFQDDEEDDYYQESLPKGKKRRCCSYCCCCFGFLLLLITSVALLVLGDYDWDAAYGMAQQWFEDSDVPHDAIDNATIPDQQYPQHPNNTAPVKRSTPRFILHIGPHKTATTSIQCALLRRPHALMEANVKYMGKAPLGHPPCDVHVDQSHEDGHVLSSMMKDMPRLHNCVNQKDCWKRFRGMVRKAFHAGKELVWSDEYLSFKTTQLEHQHPKFSKERQHFWKLLLEALHQPKAKFNITVVVTYRRWHDWLPSTKQQVEKSNPQCFPRKWPGRNVTFEDDYCIVAPMFPRLQAYMADRHRTPYPFVDELLKTLAEEYPQLNVHLINMHDQPEHDMVAKFVCDVILEGASPELCQASDKEWDNPATHPAESKAYDELTVAAWQRGLLFPTTNDGEVPTMSRNVAKTKAKQFHQGVLNETESDLPLSCPTKEQLQPLLEQSRKLEEAIVPDFYHKSPYGSVAFDDAFWKTADKHKFCSVDIDAVLDDVRWQDFFASLDQPGQP